MNIFSLNDFLREIIEAQIAKVDEQLGQLGDAKSKIEALITDLATLRAELEELKKKYSDSGTPSAVAILFYQHLGEQKEEVSNMFLKVSQKLPVSIAIKDKFGNPAAVEGAPSWALSDGALGSLSVAADGMSAEFTPAGAIGTTKIQVSADADLGEGVKSILGELDVELLAGEAVTVELAAGEAVDA